MKTFNNSPWRFSKRAAITVCLLYSGFAHSAPAAPDGLSGNLVSDTVVLEWDEVEGVAGYNVYVNNGYLTTTLTNSYTGALDAGSVYNFYVTAFTNEPTEFSPRSDQLTLPESAIPDDLTIPPSVPAGLTGTISGTNVSFSWEPSTDDEAVSGYNIYQNNQYLTTVFGTQYEGTVIEGQSYAYSVVAFDTRVNFSAASERLTLPDTGPVDTTIAPSTPDGIAGDITGSGASQTVSINWNASTDDQSVAGYNIYENDAYKTTVFSTSFEGTVQANTPYTYYIVAFDYDGNFAPRTAPLVLPDNIVVAEDTQKPSVPTDVVGTWDANGSSADITLSWTASSDNVGIAGYNVYENNSYLTTIAGTTFSTTVNSSASYSYSVVAFDIARNFSAASQRRTLPEGNNAAPTFEGLANQSGLAGDTVEVLIKPIDTDGDVPGLFIGNLPVGMQSIDNLNGTRTLRWRPLQPNVGEHNITVTAFDSVDPTLKTVQTFTLTIALPDDPSSIRNEPPGIDLIGEHLVRVGDTVVMEVKATDANGTVPDLTMTNLPAGASFNVHPTFPNIKVLRWTTDASNTGLNTLEFMAVDSEDASMTINSSVPITVAPATQFVRSGERLKVLAEEKELLIGYASLLNYFNRPDADLYQATAAEEFNIVSAENSMKWGYINPEPGEFRFAAADTLVEFANANDMKLHGHTLVWYTSLPQWVQSSPLDQREGIMNEFIDTLTARYDTVDVWDVVNEAFEDDGSYRESTWFQAMGKDYIEKAFRRARAGDPDAELIYNDYDIAYGDAKTDATYTLMEELIANDAPIDGIGFQMHIGSDFTAFDKVENTFTRFANLGLDIYITEMDVRMKDGTTDADQADVYKKIATLCLEQPACKALQVWGVTDRYTWLGSDTSPLLLDRNYQPKPAYTALQEVLAD